MSTAAGRTRCCEEAKRVNRDISPVELKMNKLYGRFSRELIELGVS